METAAELAKPVRYDTRMGWRRTRRQSSSAGDSEDYAPGEFDYTSAVKRLDEYYRIVCRQILRFQSPTTGLFPCNLAEPDKRHESHVRDSIYCAICCWSLYLAYKNFNDKSGSRRIDDDQGRIYELGQSGVKCMRGILFSWIRQAEKVEKFKHNQSLRNALHSKFHMVTGFPLYRDDEYEHLQIDCVGLYLITLVQMIASGLQVVYTSDEVTFIQNLVFYVERAYRTPDFGMWERGSKYNNGSNELHASSIGLAKAALEAINGFNLFGDQGASWSVIYVDIDAHNRNRTIFDTILPRESNSKHTDASLIPIVSWPTFAIHDEVLKTKTMDKIHRKLQGKYGYKRFLRDGFHTVLEDRNRRYYRPAEIKMFDGIECEWPMFYIYLLIDSIFKNKPDLVEKYQSIIDKLVKKTSKGVIVPKYYYVPRESVEKEQEQPGSQERVASCEETEDHLFLWGQSLYIISQLLRDGLVHINELDPIRRYLPAAERPKWSTRYSFFQGTASDLVIQIVLIAESGRLQQMLATYGILSQTPHQIEPIQIWSPNELVQAYKYLGLNKKLGLKGRPDRPIGALGTSKVYRICGNTVLCYPLLFEVTDFYLSQDISHVVEDVKSDLAFLAKSWKLSGRPTFCMLIREENIRGSNAKQLLNLLADFKNGASTGVRVRLARLQSLISSSCVEHLDFLPTSQPDFDYEFKKFEELTFQGPGNFKSLTDIPQVSLLEEHEYANFDSVVSTSTGDLVAYLRHTSNLYFLSQILHVLRDREGMNYTIDDLTVCQRLEKLVRKAGVHQAWSVVRYCSSLLCKLVDSLAPSITAILVRAKQITIGVFGHEEEVIDKPLTPLEIKNVLYTKCAPYHMKEVVLQQELILSIGKSVSTHPELYEGILKIRIGWIIQAMSSEHYYATGEEKPDAIYDLSPSDIKKLMLNVISKSSISERSPFQRRQLDGALNRVPKDFYDKVWEILERTPDGLKVAGYHLPQQPTLSDMTVYELNFSLLVEQMLSKIKDPAYRQIMVETFMVVWLILKRNPELEFKGAVDMDGLIHDAFEDFQREGSERDGLEKQETMLAFYSMAPNVRYGTSSYISKVVVHKLLHGEMKSSDYEDKCAIS